MSVFDEVLIAFGGNTALLLVLGFLARSLINTLLAKDIKKFETDLQNRATSELERLRADLKSQGDASIEELRSRLQHATIEHQVRFAKLHEERAKRIADLYERMSAQSVACQRYVYQLGQVNRQEGFSEIEAQFADLYLFLETSRIYLPEHICILLDKLIGEVRKAVVGVYVYSGTTDQANANVQEERSKTFLGAVKAFEVEIPAAKKALEDEFRKMLGVDNSRPE